MNKKRNLIGRLRVKEPRDTAAGVASVKNSVRIAARKMGFKRGMKALSALNQQGGIDCQSCAWPDPLKRTRAEFCENGVKALADEATTKLIDDKFFADRTVGELLTYSEHWLNEQGRLTRPMVLREGAEHFEPITWEEAFRIISRELNALPSPDDAAFYTSGRTSNEAAFLYQLFVRQFGTNNFPDCSNMCHESTSVALTETIGLGKATVRLEDLESAGLIIVMGQNPGTNAPRMMTSLKKAKLAGAKIIAVNPLPEAGLTRFKDPNPEHYDSLIGFAKELFIGDGAEIADVRIPVRIGGDMAFLKGVMKSILEREKKSPEPIFDYGFIGEHTAGFDDFIAGLERIGWPEILDRSGLTFDDIEEVADLIIASHSVVTCWAMGITQHKDSVNTIKDIVNLHLLTGNIGKPGAGLLPVRGHSNVQGDRTMGIWNHLRPEFKERLEREFSFKAPGNDGFATVDSIKAMHDGRVRVFVALGGNFAAAAPDTEFTEEALSRCELTVNILTKLNRSAIIGGKTRLILPCLGRSEKDLQISGEQFVTTENTMLNVQVSQGILEPASEHLRSEVWIVARMARAVLGSRTSVQWETFTENYDRIRDKIERVIPGFEKYNARVRQPGGFFLPNPPRERRFPTSDGLARFTVSSIAPFTLLDGQLAMTSIRSHDQFNTTVYELNDVYRGIFGSRRVILMNSDDIGLLGLKNGEIVDITSHFTDRERTIERFVVVPYEIPQGCCATYFPEANPLVPIDSKADGSNCPTSKMVVVTVTSHRKNGKRVMTGEFDC